MSPDEGRHSQGQILAPKVPLLKELNPLLSGFTQGFISGFALIPLMGFAGVPCLKALVISLNFDALAF